MALAFLPVPQAVTETPVESKPKLPVFKPRWWYKDDRLDARPVIWSLENRPEEWEIDSVGNPHSYDTWFTLTHKPSKHRFMRYSTGSSTLMSGVQCSCNGSQFQMGHATALGAAMNKWRKKYAPITPLNGVDGQFASHFIHD